MITYIELLKWYRENYESLTDIKIKNIYSFDDNKGVCFSIYSKNSKFKYVYIIPGKICFLSDEKLDLGINKFVLRLRKDLKGKKVNFYVDNDYKILVLEPSDNKNLKVYFELIPNGVIAVVESDMIKYANIYKDFGSRKILRGAKYDKPPTKDIIVKDFDVFKEIISKSNKKGIVRKLAIDLTLGGKYSEYILDSLNIDKNKDFLEDDEIFRIYQMYLEILNSNFVIDNEKKVRYNINEYFIELYKKYSNPIEKLEKEKEKILNVINNLKENKNKLIDEINEKEKIANFLTTYSWIFKDYNIGRIKEEFENLGLKVRVWREGYKILIEVEE